MQKVKVMCLVVSALLAVSCATLHRSMSVGVGIGMGTEASANMATAREGAHGEEAETASLNSGALRCNIERSAL